MNMEPGDFPGRQDNEVRSGILPREVRDRFEAWWNRSSLGRPLLHVVAIRDAPVGGCVPFPDAADPEALHLDVDRKVRWMQERMRTHLHMAEAFPNLDVDIGPGSLAVYLGSEPVFAWDTIWYRESVHDWKTKGELVFDDTNRWWRLHREKIRRAKALAQGRFLVNVPDLIENVDILASLRGAQNLCMDLVDDPEEVERRIDQIDRAYIEYFDRLREIVRGIDGSCSYTSFQIWGSGRTAKIQCDFSAMMSPLQFRRFVAPSLRRQCSWLDHSLYHLDGPDAVRHLDALMEIEDLDALQWTPGAGRPDGGWEGWYDIHDIVRRARKSLWIRMHDGGFDQWLARSDRLVDRYGPDGLYLLYPAMTEDQAERLVTHAENHWS
jgi:5-methyltetrahydrofolate--homocysteine methyltransferase